MELKNYREELEAKLIDRALKDEKFRQELLSNPKGTLTKELGITLPESLSITIIEEQENEVCLVIPKVIGSEVELSELELESVAGGGWSNDCHTANGPNCPDT